MAQIWWGHLLSHIIWCCVTNLVGLFFMLVIYSKLGKEMFLFWDCLIWLLLFDSCLLWLLRDTKNLMWVFPALWFIHLQCIKRGHLEQDFWGPGVYLSPQPWNFLLATGKVYSHYSERILMFPPCKYVRSYFKIWYITANVPL